MNEPNVNFNGINGYKHSIDKKSYSSEDIIVSVDVTGKRIQYDSLKDYYQTIGVPQDYKLGVLVSAGIDPNRLGNINTSSSSLTLEQNITNALNTIDNYEQPTD